MTRPLPALSCILKIFDTVVKEGLFVISSDSLASSSSNSAVSVFASDIACGAFDLEIPVVVANPLTLYGVIDEDDGIDICWRKEIEPLERFKILFVFSTEELLRVAMLRLIIFAKG